MAPTTTIEANQTMHEIDLYLATIPGAERAEAERLAGHVGQLAGEIERLERSGNFTPVGVGAQIGPLAARVKQQLDVYEQRTRNDADKLREAREAIEEGRRVRGENGHFETVPVRQLSAAEEVRAGEIRAWFRAMERPERHDAALRAFRENDSETIEALERAPKSLPAMEPTTLRMIRQLRWQAAGWEDSYEQQLKQVQARQYFAGKIRKALGLGGGI